MSLDWTFQASYEDFGAQREQEQKIPVFIDELTQ